MITIDIIIPTLNESKFIRNSLDSVLAFKIPLNTIVKIYVVDGGSEDNTKEIVNEYISKFSNIHLLNNPNKIQPSALNIGIQNSSGDFIMRLDAHSMYPNDYLTKCYDTMVDSDADNVGGIFVPVFKEKSLFPTLVMALTTHRFGVGNGEFRVSLQSKFVDTVPYGFFKRKIFDKIGLFDERAYAIEDFEFNSRIRKFNGKIFLNSEIKVFYFNQSSLISFYKKQFFRDGPGNAYLWFIAPYAFALRHAIPFLFFLFICSIPISYFISLYLFYFNLIILFFYFFLAMLSSLQQSVRLKKVYLFFLLPFCFFAFHVLYGFGTFIGSIRLLFKRAPYIHYKP